jgi:hypothetical protein
MDMKKILQAIDSVSTTPVEGADSMARFLRVVKEAEINQPTSETVEYLPPDPEISAQLRAQSDASMEADRPKHQANAFIRYSSGLYDMSTLPKTINIKSGVTLPVRFNPIKNMDGDVLANATAANKLLPPELQYSPNELSQVVGQNTVQESIDTFLSIVKKNDVSILNEAANPHKVTLPVQMVMQHYSNPIEKKSPKTSLLKSYFETIDSAIKEEQAAEQAVKEQHLRQYSQRIAERVLMKESWSDKYKNSINCSHPKGFSQKAHCAGKKKHNESHSVYESVCPECGMCESHGNIMEIKKGQKDSNGYTKCWSGYHAAGTKKSATTGKQVRNCVKNEEQQTTEATALEKFRRAADEREKKHDKVEKEMKARHARGEEDMKGSIDRLEKQLKEIGLAEGLADDEYAGTYSPEAIKIGRYLIKTFNLTNELDQQLAIEIVDNEISSGETDLAVIKKQVIKYLRKSGTVVQLRKKQDVAEGWSDAMVSRRTGTPRTPYSVYIKGKKWKDFENDDHARAVMDKLKDKFKADGRDPSVITIAPTDYDKI